MQLSSCIGYYSDISHFSEDELKWIDCYNVGDTVLFISNNQNIDTLIVDRKKLWNSNNPFFIHFFDDYMGDKYNAHASCSFHIRNSTKIMTGFLEIEKFAENDSIQWSARLDDRYSESWPFTYDFESQRNDYIGENPAKVISMNFKDTNLPYCIIFDDTNSRIIKNEFNALKEIEKFIISKEYGLVYYKLQTGEEYYRQL